MFSQGSFIPVFIITHLFLRSCGFNCFAYNLPDRVDCSVWFSGQVYLLVGQSLICALAVSAEASGLKLELEGG
jgi:hypothetical protein